ncbi:DNA primase [Granulicatella sp. zg-ZJ]|uniref:phage/plasmid primase, P4 family n=1 Tax=Granulicatella sp. zg-ZJ TaxID=2678504 RepID=UPI0013D10BED|nr:phage/plasmid primase, P4 family [Granulicatella sp. zg-ZJ]NEW62270.1 DNA primase [Granulicatella sp. zg-ZJ]
MQLTIYNSTHQGNAKNCIYTNKHIVTSAEELMDVVSFDHVCASFENHYRSKDNFLECDCDVFDCDNDHSDEPSDWIYPEDYEFLLGGASYAIVTSRNDGKVKNGKSARPRHHLYIPHRVFQFARECEVFKQRFYERFSFLDGNAKDAARFIFGHPVSEVMWFEGTVDIEDVIGFEQTNLFEQFDEASFTIQSGSRNATMSHIAGKLIKRYGNTDECYALFLKEAEKCSPLLEESELMTIWKSATKFGTKVSNQQGYIPPEYYNQELTLLPSDFSDVGQATVLAREYADKIKYSPATDYLVYNGSYWEESLPNAQALSQELTERQLEEAELEIQKCIKELNQLGAMAIILSLGEKKAVGQFNDNQKRVFEKYKNALVYQKYAIKRRDSKYIWSALKEVRPLVQIEPVMLDKDEFLLNTPTSTIDLRTGSSKSHEHQDFITKQTSVAPSDTGMVIWKEALNTFFTNNQELIDYVQQIVGLASVGKVYVEALIIAYGEGRNGKSTFWNVIARVLGTYSGNISADMLTVGCRRNVKPELAEAKGKRLLIAAELEEGMRMNTSNVKQLCSTDEIFAEKKFKSPFSYVPTHTLVLYTNHLPKVGALDKGTWRRLIVIPFNAKIEGSNDIKNYADYLYEECGEAILSWIIEGAKSVIASHFKITKPQVVEEAIKVYKENNDWLNHFIEECCEVDVSVVEKSGELYSEYRAFCLRNGEFTRGTADFYAALENADFKRKKNMKGSLVYGIKLKSEFE